MNKHTESGQPFDFEIIVTKNEQEKTRHLEVKASSSQKEDIEIHLSSAEWQNMNEYNNDPQKSYRLFIVTDLLNNKPQIKKINIFSELQAQSIKTADYKKLTITL